MKPFATTPTDREQIYNYRLSRARRIVENAFGILVSRFRVFEKPIPLPPESADVIVLATCSLHNWLKKSSDTYITQRCVDFEDQYHNRIIPGSWRDEIRVIWSNLPLTRNNHASRVFKTSNGNKRYLC